MQPLETQLNAYCAGLEGRVRKDGSARLWVDFRAADDVATWRCWKSGMGYALAARYGTGRTYPSVRAADEDARRRVRRVQIHLHQRVSYGTARNARVSQKHLLRARAWIAAGSPLHPKRRSFKVARPLIRPKS